MTPIEARSLLQPKDLACRQARPIAESNEVSVQHLS